MKKYRKRGYWQKKENVIQELKNAIKKLGHFPNSGELKDLGLSVLDTVMYRFGGRNRLREELGCRILRRTSWNYEETLEMGRNLISIYGELPKENFLRKIGLSTFNYAVNKHGGHEKICKELDEKPRRAAKGLLEDLNYVIGLAKSFLNNHPEYKVLPAREILRTYEDGKQIASAVDKYHGGVRNLRSILGQTNRLANPGDRRDLQLLLSQAKEIMEKHDLSEVPSSTTFRKLGYEFVVHSAVHYHGGFRVFREKLRQYLGKPSEDQELETMLEGYVGGKV